MAIDPQDRRALLAELERAGAQVKRDGQEIKCPFHEDKHPSGDVYQGKDGSWRYKCHAGSCGFCGDVFDVIARAENRSLADVLKEHKADDRPILAQNGQKSAGPRVYESLDAIKSRILGEVEALYTYTNPATGKPDLVVIRYRHDGKKHFWQASPYGDGWILKRPEGLLPLYNRTAMQSSSVVVVLVVEGEKCVHALRSCGIVGTTSPMGAGNGAYADWSPLAGKSVILWPDNDEAGVKHMKGVAKILKDLKPPAKLFWVDPATLQLPPKGDVADFIADKSPHQAAEAVTAVMDSALPMAPIGELHELLEATIAGKRTAIPWPWASTTLLSRALLPGTVTLFGGTPGSSKSFAMLDCLKTWHEQGVKVAVFELEEDRGYHLQRALAQLVGDSDYLDPDWIKMNGDLVRTQAKTYESLLDAIGAMIYDAPDQQVTYDDLVKWTGERAADGCRVIVIDPVTAVAPTRDVWIADSEFLFKVKTIARHYSCSIVLVTHPRKGTKGQICTMDDMAGGAAFQRFCQTALWLESPRAAKSLTVRTMFGSVSMKCNRILHLLKCRNGPGHGLKIGMNWDGPKLRLTEEGLVTQEDE